MRRESFERYPALAASAILHVGAFVAALLLGSLLNKPVYGPTVVPVTLINTADLNPAPAVEAPAPTPSVAPPSPPTPEVAPEPTPQPTPAPKPAKVTPPPVPTPKPAKLAPTPPRPAPKPPPTPPTKAQAKPAPQAPDDDAFMNSLSKDLAHSGKQPTPPRPAARPVAGTGSAPSAAALASLSAQLQRLWNPNCGVLGGADINLTVRFVLGPSGRVIGQPVSSVGDSSDPIVKAASDRAIRSVFQAQPITGLNPDRYTVNFNAKQACAQ